MLHMTVNRVTGTVLLASLCFRCLVHALAAHVHSNQMTDAQLALSGNSALTHTTLRASNAEILDSPQGPTQLTSSIWTL